MKRKGIKGLWKSLNYKCSCIQEFTVEHIFGHKACSHCFSYKRFLYAEIYAYTLIWYFCYQLTLRRSDLADYVDKRLQFIIIIIIKCLGQNSGRSSIKWLEMVIVISN